MHKKWLPPLGLSLTLLLTLGLGRMAVAADGDVKKGAEIYEVQKCGRCHGKLGKGDGRVLLKLKVKSVDWTDNDAMGKLSDDYLFTIIQKGGKAIGKSQKMLPYGRKLRDTETKDLIAFIRSLAK